MTNSLVNPESWQWPSKDMATLQLYVVTLNISMLCTVVVCINRIGVDVFQ